jgi:hypothetical protein
VKGIFYDKFLNTITGYARDPNADTANESFS